MSGELLQHLPADAAVADDEQSATLSSSSADDEKSPTPISSSAAIADDEKSPTPISSAAALPRKLQVRRKNRLGLFMNKEDACRHCKQCRGCGGWACADDEFAYCGGDFRCGPYNVCIHCAWGGREPDHYYCKYHWQKMLHDPQLQLDFDWSFTPPSQARENEIKRDALRWLCSTCNKPSRVMFRCAAAVAGSGTSKHRETNDEDGECQQCLRRRLCIGYFGKPKNAVSN